MGLFDTNRGEVARERLQDARKALAELIGFAQQAHDQMDRDIQVGPLTHAFPISWGSMMAEKLLTVNCEISRCNGALLVLGTEKKEAATTS